MNIESQLFKNSRMCIATTHTFFMQKNRVGATPTLSDYVLLLFSLNIVCILHLLFLLCLL